jgi:hypothetical protein
MSKSVAEWNELDTYLNNIIQLLSFDSVNVWFYWLLKKIIFTEAALQSEHHFFSSKVN